MSGSEPHRLRLAETDRLLAERALALHTLDPGRQRPTSLVVLAERLFFVGEASGPPGLVARCADGLDRIARSQLRHFPENLFWDFDYIAATLVAVAGGATPQEFEHHVDLFVELQGAFGCQSPIRFRYVHDFVCGLDWARFVSRDPSARQAIGPFDRVFLERVLRRGGELRRAIERGDDPDYPPLGAGEWRNPFGFSRIPEHELMLHRELAAAGLIPVQCWRADASPDWRKPYTQLRLERARALGIAGDYAGLSRPPPVA